jgi:hypothetical protein
LAQLNHGMRIPSDEYAILRDDDSRAVATIEQSTIAAQIIRILGVEYQAAPLAMMWNTNPSTIIPTATAAIGSRTSAHGALPLFAMETRPSWSLMYLGTWWLTAGLQAATEPSVAHGE